MISVSVEYWVLVTEGDEYQYSEDIEMFGTAAVDYENLLRNADKIPEIMHGRRKMVIDDGVTVFELWNKILCEVDFGGLAEECREPCFYVDGLIMNVFDDSYCLKDFMDKYIKSNYIKLFFVVSNAAGDVFRDDGLRYYFNSHEAGKHHIPHIHVDYRHEKSGTFSIISGERIEGDNPRKIEKKIKKKILDNQMSLIECWNKETDGIAVDINNLFGYRPVIGVE